MKRLGIYGTRASDALSALLVLFAVMLAGGYGPLAGQVSALPSAESGTSGAGTGSQRSAPAITKQQIFVSETRDVSSAGWDDGHPKTFVASRSFDLEQNTAGVTVSFPGAVVTLAFAASPFDARGPPSIS